MSKDEKIEFTVERSRWRRGRRGNSLLNADGSMCCLGFLGEKLGLPSYDMQLVGHPCYTTGDRGICNVWPSSLVIKEGTVDAIPHDTEACLEIINTNDEPDLSEPVRERRLTKLFKDAGITVEFVD